MPELPAAPVETVRQTNAHRLLNKAPLALVQGARRGLLALLIAAAPGVNQAALPLAVDGQPLPSLAPMLEHVTPAVVNISAQSDPRQTAAGGDVRAQGMRQNVGSGVIVDAAQGNILTNHHVVRGASAIRVSLQDGRSFTATVVGSDPDTDLAVLRIPAQNLQALSLSDSSDLRVGDFVVAIGDPFGLGQSASSGIVSALDRSNLRAAGYQNFIQTDASINPGNSGGALVNLNGELVGINTMIYTPSGGNVGIGFAIPSNLAGEVMRQLLQHGQVQRGGLGLDTLDITPRNARQLGLAPGSTGVAVARVTDGSPAQKAGVQARDQILSVDGKAVSTSAQLRNAEGLLPVGREVRLALQRAGARIEISLRIEPEQSERLHGGSLDARLTGVEFSEIARAQRVQGNDGVAISATYPERGPVAARVQRGDIIIGLNQRPVSKLADLRDLLAGVGRQPLILTLVRGRSVYSLQVN
ncbi:trypsin-like peptidase domain-containing protein [Achromobacter seleniivolatilans]|uniref:Trypsin-like peptidase domain-containing protein n=1 Tax=Achromobacter seleniivolatilans TaxID=3047478 RepID=A0ABY9M284_9BURK|nr:trypsin-like peptidase domain-containing protein [Achromobacter sp. R39]WMD20860.1 trypsin-like peptidase domain-containing protein [Achromobacter sp. R39]